MLPGKKWRERRLWHKIHIGIDEETSEIRAVLCHQAIAKQSAERDVTSSCIGDPPMLPNLLGQIAQDQKIGSVTAPSHACKHGIVGQWMGRMIRGFARSGLKRATGSIPRRPSPRRCHDAIAVRNARAVIPPRKNAKLWKPDTLGPRARNEAVWSSKDLGRAQWRRLSGYHRRSRVETTVLGSCDG